ncbi:tripartite tricarboxylate transporter substrate binding protein [Roseomonas nepalensis]|uniref:Tripartite tricarboxylate transporter substrate binding protein n=1 Tax=Muricoccus nepalensis TaxID=1854500 RepID=A0A502EZV8_9PROT|nr:tripartite tricarboxylate transporter substrate-binding protein [Roseomonas nepalensis]TPG41896.1 tripartite tricarboxylate transporter substrate binding protein [Roseomonas nepalensis]
MIARRILLSAPALLARPATARAQSWPARPLRLIVAYPPGGAVDLAGRLIAEALSARLGQSVVVENRTGGGGTIGTAAVTNAVPDGYTLGASAVNSLAINQYLYRNLPYDPQKDLMPVSLGWEAPLVVVVPVDHVPSKTLREFVTWAKARPDGVAFGSSGVGTTVHLSGEMLCRRTGIQGTHVPFRGGADALTSMLRGDIQFVVDNVPTALANLRGGKLRALAVTSAEHSLDLPDVPTMAEAGVQDFVVTSWGALTVPAGTPGPVVQRLSEAMRDAAADPAVQARFRPTGNRILGTTPQEAAARAARERPMWAQLVRQSGATLD